MRLICPNCSAHYEVDAGAVPDTGRDVLCSACNHGWFQPRPDAGADAPAPPQRRKPLDEAVVRILREEAEREARARRAEGAMPETQPDLGLPPPPRKPYRLPEIEAEYGPLRRPGSPLQGAQSRASLTDPADKAQPGANDAPRDAVADRAPPASAPSSREADAGPSPQAVTPPDARPAHVRERALLPDIEEITSALHATARIRTRSRSADRRRGFGLGFGFMTGAAIALAGLYLGAPALAPRAPQLAPHLTAYVGQVDMARGWLHAQIPPALRP